MSDRDRIIQQARGEIICPIHGIASCGCEVAKDIEAIREQAFIDGVSVGKGMCRAVPGSSPNA